MLQLTQYFQQNQGEGLRDQVPYFTKFQNISQLINKEGESAISCLSNNKILDLQKKIKNEQVNLQNNIQCRRMTATLNHQRKIITQNKTNYQNFLSKFKINQSETSIQSPRNLLKNNHLQISQQNISLESSYFPKQSPIALKQDQNPTSNNFRDYKQDPNGLIQQAQQQSNRQKKIIFSRASMKNLKYQHINETSFNHLGLQEELFQLQSIYQDSRERISNKQIEEKVEKDNSKNIDQSMKEDFQGNITQYYFKKSPYMEKKNAKFLSFKKFTPYTSFYNSDIDDNQQNLQSRLPSNYRIEKQLIRNIRSKDIQQRQQTPSTQSLTQSRPQEYYQCDSIKSYNEITTPQDSTHKNKALLYLEKNMVQNQIEKGVNSVISQSQIINQQINNENLMRRSSINKIYKVKILNKKYAILHNNKSSEKQRFSI